MKMCERRSKSESMDVQHASSSKRKGEAIATATSTRVPQAEGTRNKLDL